MVRLSVVQVLPALNSGGVERGTLEIARELVDQGHRSVVISAGGRLVPELLHDGSEHLAWPLGAKSPVTLRWIWPLRRWLADQHIDILHIRSRMPGWIGWLAWRRMEPLTRPRLLTTVHGLYSASPYSAIMTHSERVIAVSETVRTYLHQHYPKLPAERVQVIQRGVDPLAFPYGYQPGNDWLTEWYRCYPHLRGAVILTLPGRLSRLKGHEDFIDLIARLRERGLAVYGLIVGGVEPRRHAYVDGLRAQVRAHGLGDTVIFTGHRSDMREIYAVSSLVFSLSVKPEAFGRTVLEALSLGTPVVGYDHGGVGEILRRIYPDGLVPTGHRDKMVERVLALLAAKIPVPAEPVFPLRRMLDETLALYTALHQSPRTGA